MQLFSINLILIASTFTSLVSADYATDATNLQAIASGNADTVFASLNGTAYLNTSDLVSQMATAIQGADSTMMANISSSGNSNTTLNEAYLNYVDKLGYFADTVQRRGRLFHSELNQPVYQALQALSSAAYNYGWDLTSRGLIGRNSTIRTMTSGTSISRAQGAWVNNQNFPGV